MQNTRMKVLYNLKKSLKKKIQVIVKPKYKNFIEKSNI